MFTNNKQREGLPRLGYGLMRARMQDSIVTRSEAKQTSDLAGARTAVRLLENPQPKLGGELAPRWLGEHLRIRGSSLLMVFGPWVLVATLLDPKGRRAHLPPGARVCLCSHRPSPPRPTPIPWGPMSRSCWRRGRRCPDTRDSSTGRLRHDISEAEMMDEFKCAAHAERLIAAVTEAVRGLDRKRSIGLYKIARFECFVSGAATQ